MDEEKRPQEGDGKKPPGQEGKSHLPSAGSTTRKKPRGPPTEAERQFAAAAVEVMCGGATPEAQHAFILLHPRLLPSSPPSSARRATRRLFQLWLRELTATLSAPGQQPSADDLLRRQSLLSFIHVWAKHFHGDLSPSRCSAAIKLLSLVLTPSSHNPATPPQSPTSPSSSSTDATSSSSSPSASPKRRPSLNDEHRRMLNEFKLLFLQHRGGAASRTDRLLIDAAAATESSPPLSPSSPSRASVSLTSSPSLHLGSASAPLASAPLLHSSASSVPALRSSTSPRARHSVAVTSLPADDGGANADVSITRPSQSRSAEMAVVSDRGLGKNSKNGRLHTSDETSLVSGSSGDKNSPRDTSASGGESGVVESDESAATAKESGRRRGRASMHVRSDSVGAILSIPQRPGRRTPRLRFLDVPLELLAEEMAVHEIRLMHAVGPREFLDQGWQKNADLNLAPNITAIIDRFNQVSYWTTTEVLTKDTPQLMAKTIKRFIKLAWIFYEMNNFNSLMEIVSGLNSAAVQRLSVWKEVPEKYARRFREMDALMQMKQNYRSYRERLAELLPFLLPSPASPAASASSPLASLHSSHSLPTSLSLSIAAVAASGAAAGTQQPPASPSSSASNKKAGKVVPYFAVFLRDVTFAMVGNPLYLPPAQKPPMTKAKSTTASPARPRRRLSESDAENAKNVEENENEDESENEEGEEEMQRGRETPIEGGAINMDRVQLMYDQVQTFQLLRHEMRGYEFLERQKREKEDKEFLRRLIREYQADLRAITNADVLYDLSLAAEGNALPTNALSTSPGPRSPARQSIMVPAAPPPPSSRNSLSSSSSTTATRQTLPSLVSAFGSIASSSSAVVSRDSSRSHRLSVSNSLSPPLSPASSSPIASAAFSAFSRSSSGSIRLRSASDDASMAAPGSSVDVDTGDDTEDDDVDLDYGDAEPEAAAKQRQSPKPTATTRRKSRLRRKDVQSMRRVSSSPDNNNGGGGGDEATTTKAAAKRPTASSSRSAFGLRRSSEPSAAEAELSSSSSSSDTSPSTTANGDLFSSSSTLSLSHLLHASSSSSSPSTLSTSPPSSSSSLSTSKGSRREFTFRKGKANISDGDLVSKVAVEVRSFVGNVSRPLLLTFRDTFDDFLGKAGLRHENSPVVSFVYEAPRAPDAESTTTSTPATATTAVVKGEKLVVEDDEGFDAFKRWALRQSERATIDVWLFVGVY